MDGCASTCPTLLSPRLSPRLSSRPSAHAPRAQDSLPTLLRLAGAGAERLYSNELDRLGLLLWFAPRPSQSTHPPHPTHPSHPHLPCLQTAPRPLTPHPLPVPILAQPRRGRRGAARIARPQPAIAQRRPRAMAHPACGRPPRGRPAACAACGTRGGPHARAPPRRRAGWRRRRPRRPRCLGTRWWRDGHGAAAATAGRAHLRRGITGL